WFAIILPCFRRMALQAFLRGLSPSRNIFHLSFDIFCVHLKHFGRAKLDNARLKSMSYADGKWQMKNVK
ncbi:MAG: hypothetical protein DMF74_11950, partial [Acidobacteria bacterium]